MSKKWKSVKNWLVLKKNKSKDKKYHEIIRCKRCNKALTSEKSRELGYGRTCFKIVHSHQEKEKNYPDLDPILERIRKLELDNNFMKHQLKHKTLDFNSKDSMLDWDIKPEVKKKKDEYEIKFTVIIKELKVIFHEGFDYHEVLKPVNPIEEPKDPPLLTENSKITIENIELLN